MPEFYIELPFSKELIERFWAQDPLDRPTFDQIITELHENIDILIDKYDIDIDEFDQRRSK